MAFSGSNPSIVRGRKVYSGSDHSGLLETTNIRRIVGIEEVVVVESSEDEE
jgi:hypothetical protein